MDSSNSERGGRGMPKATTSSGDQKRSKKSLQTQEQTVPEPGPSRSIEEKSKSKSEESTKPPRSNSYIPSSLSLAQLQPSKRRRETVSGSEISPGTAGGAISIEHLGLRYPLRNRLKLLKKQSSVSPHSAGKEGSKIPVPIKKRRVDTGEECSNPEEPQTTASSSSDSALEQLPPLIRKKPIAVPIKKRQELRQSSAPDLGTGIAARRTLETPSRRPSETSARNTGVETRGSLRRSGVGTSHSSTTGSCASSSRGRVSRGGGGGGASSSSAVTTAGAVGGSAATTGNSSKLPVSGTSSAATATTAAAMADHGLPSSSSNNSPPQNGATAGGGLSSFGFGADDAGTGSGAGSSGSSTSEVGRLQALLEARGLPPHLFGALGPRMQHLIQRSIGVSAGGGGTGSRVQSLLSSLTATGEEGRQLTALGELTQMLVMGNEDSLAGFPVKQTVPALINLIRVEHNFEIMHQACRALTYLLEALPRSSPIVVEAVPDLIARVQVIPCMDVAEQSLSALQMLSRRHPKPILQACGVSSCLLYLDFFSLSAQRSALAVAANCCQGLQPEEFTYVVDALPILTQRLSHQDRKSVESVCVAFSRLVEAFATDPDKLQAIASHGLLLNLQQLLMVSPPMISTGTFIMVLRLLANMCTGCPALAAALLQQNIADTLRFLLVGPPNENVTSIASPEVELVSRSPQELYEIVCLIGELMPPLPTTGIFSVDSLLSRSSGIQQETIAWQWRDDRSTWHNYSPLDSRIIEAAHQSGEEEVSLSAQGHAYTVDFSTMQQINEDTGTARPVQRKKSPLQPNGETRGEEEEGEVKATDDARRMALEGDPQLSSNVIRSLFGVLYEVYSSSAGPAVRYKCLRALLRMVHFASPHLLEGVLRLQQVSSQLSSMLSSQDVRVVVGALQMAQILLQKLPAVFCIYFQREGVIHQVQHLAVQEIPNESSVSNGCVGATHCVPSSSGLPPTPPLSTNHMEAKVTSSRMGPSSADDRSNSPSQLRLSDVLKRKRNTTSRRTPTAARKARAEDNHSFSPPTADGKEGTSRGAGPGRNFLSSLNPARWGSSNSSRHQHPSESSPKEPGPSSSSPVMVLQSHVNHHHHQHQHQQQQRSQVWTWVVKQSQEFLGLQEEAATMHQGTEMGLNHVAGFSILKALTQAVQALQNSKTKEGCVDALQGMSVIIQESDVSPFEVLHSGLVTVLLEFLTSRGSPTPLDRDSRLRAFSHVFLSSPLERLSKEGPWKAAGSPGLGPLISKLLGCLHQQEQFPVRVHDWALGLPGPGASGAGSSGSSGMGSSASPRNGTSSALRFLNTHQLKCLLQRHPSCSTLRNWKGGPVKVDPLALVQAVERYLLLRGYGRPRESSPRDRDYASDRDDDDTSEDDPSDDDMEDSLVAVLQNQTGSRHRLEFLIGDQVIPYNMTVYQAVRQYSPAANNGCYDGVGECHDHEGSSPLGGPNIWAQTHTIYYRPLSEDDASTSRGEKNVSTGSSGGSGSTSGNGSSWASAIRAGKGGRGKGKKAGDRLWNEGEVPLQVSPLDQFLTSSLPPCVTVEDPSLETLALLRALNALNRYWGSLFTLPSYQPILSQQDFLSSKLTAKANRQLQDPLVIMTGNLPPWLHQIAQACPFLFPFETRQLLFHCVTFDRDRALQRLLDVQPELAQEAGDRLAPRFDRRKRTVSRNDILRQAEALLTEAGSSKALLEIQYEGEVGTGLGPTLEFYTLVSRELQRSDQQLWRGEDVSGHIFSPTGLFPAPQPRSAKSSTINKIKTKFRFLGRLMAKALMDSRMLDLPLSEAFYAWLLGEERCLTVKDVAHIDTTMARSLSELIDLVRRRELAEWDGNGETETLVTAVDDLALDFTLPGHGMELCKGGRDITVTLENLQKYLQLVCHWTLVEGVSRQMEAFKEGFEAVFPLTNLNLFYSWELDQLFCGGGSQSAAGNSWDVRTLVEACRPDHGYTHESRAIKWLFEILSSYSEEEKRRFLQFVTGSPRLPVGGFKSLSPPLTVVRKTLEPDEDADAFLPSVMTCVNYLKLPDYSSSEVMRMKLDVATREGQLSFHLS